jgi:hypothetical protein
MAALSKAERRELRKAERTEKDKVKALKLAAELGEAVKTPRVAEVIPLRRAPRIAAWPASDKTVKTPKEPYADILDCRMTWCKTQADLAGSWSWGEKRQWTPEEWEDDIEPTLNSASQSDWNNILNVQKVTVRDGKQVPKHHHQEVSTLVKEAQERWIEHDLYEYDTAFRFRFGGTLRAWGVRLKGHFYLVWWDRYHNIYPV